MELNISEPFASEANSSGVSWPAVIGGAFVSAAFICHSACARRWSRIIVSFTLV